MTQCVGILLLLYVLTLAADKISEACEEVGRRCKRVKQRRLRKAAIETNRMLYRQTGEDYYRQRADELEKGA